MQHEDRQHARGVRDLRDLGVPDDIYTMGEDQLMYFDVPSNSLLPLAGSLTVSVCVDTGGKL
jgi:hypothetical protein